MCSIWFSFVLTARKAGQSLWNISTIATNRNSGKFFLRHKWQKFCIKHQNRTIVRFFNQTNSIENLSVASKQMQKNLIKKEKKTELYLGMGNDSDGLAITNHFLEIVIDALLAEFVGPFFVGLGECLLLALVPENRLKLLLKHTEEKEGLFYERRLSIKPC